MKTVYISRKGTHVPEVNVCIRTLAKRLAIRHYKYSMYLINTKQEIDHADPWP